MVKHLLVFAASAATVYGFYALIAIAAARRRARSRAAWSIGSGACAAADDSRGWISVGYSNALVRFYERTLKYPLNGGEPLRVGPDGFGLAGLAVRWASGQRLLTVATGLHEISVYDITTPARIRGRPLQTHVADAAITCLDLHPDGSKVVFGDAEGRVRVWNWRDGDVPRILKVHDPFSAVRHVTYADSGSLLAASGDDQVALWDPESELHIASIDHSRVTSASFSHGAELVAVSGNGMTAVLDVEESRQLLTVDQPGVWSATFTPNNEVLATISDDSVCFWEAATSRQCSAPLAVHGVLYTRFIDNRTILAIDRAGLVHEHRISPVASPVLAGAAAGTSVHPITFGEGLPEPAAAPSMVTAVVRHRVEPGIRIRSFVTRYRAPIASLSGGLAVSLGVYFWSLRPSPPPLPAPAVVARPSLSRYSFYDVVPRPPLPKPAIQEAVARHREAKDLQRNNNPAGANRDLTMAAQIAESARQQISGYGKVAAGLIQDNPDMDRILAQGKVPVKESIGTMLARSLTDPKSRNELANVERWAAVINADLSRSIERVLAQERARAKSVGAPITVINLQIAGLEGLGDALKEPSAIPVEKVVSFKRRIKERIKEAVTTLVTELKDTKLRDSSALSKPTPSVIKKALPEQYQSVLKELARARKAAAKKNRAKGYYGSARRRRV